MRPYPPPGPGYRIHYMGEGENEVEWPLLPVKIAERLHQTIGSRETAVFTKDTPRDFIKSPEHVGPWSGRLPLPGRTFHQGHFRVKESAEALVT